MRSHGLPLRRMPRSRWLRDQPAVRLSKLSNRLRVSSLPRGAGVACHLAETLTWHSGGGALPTSVTELLFDGTPGAPDAVTFAVRVFPETESVLVYLSPDDPCRVRCEGLLTYVTAMTDAGRLFVERLSEISRFEVTIVAKGKFLCGDPRR